MKKEKKMEQLTTASGGNRAGGAMAPDNELVGRKVNSILDGRKKGSNFTLYKWASLPIRKKKKIEYSITKYGYYYFNHLRFLCILL